MKNYDTKSKFRQIMVCSILLLYGLSTFAQEYSAIEDVDILEEQKTVLMRDYPHIFTGVEIKDVRKINSKHSKVFYENGNQQYEAVVNSDRKDMLLVATCRVISEKEMPEVVMDAFKNSKYENWDIIETFEVTTPDSGLFYRIDVSKNNTMNEKEEIKSIFYTHLGQYRKPPY